MKQIIHLKSEGVRIAVTDDKEIEEKQNISIEGATAQCIKHVYRYGEFIMPKNIMIAILWKAYKGCGCKQDHLDVAQRFSLYEYLKDKEIEDPYIEQFMKETKENFKYVNI